MVDADRERFLSLLMALAGVFRVDPTEALLEGYWIGCRSMPLEAFSHACARAMESCEHMPRPRELRELAGEVSTPDRAIIAWEAVRKAIRSLGAYKSVRFDDPVTNAAVRNIGGWRELCSLSAEDLESFRRPRFEKAYRALADLPLSPEATGYLSGIHESENAGLAGVETPVHTVRVGLPAPPTAARPALEGRRAPATDAVAGLLGDLTRGRA